MYIRTQKKQNYANGVDFLQYYKNNWTHYILHYWVINKSNFMHNDKNSVERLKTEKNMHSSKCYSVLVVDAKTLIF